MLSRKSNLPFRYGVYTLVAAGTLGTLTAISTPSRDIANIRAVLTTLAGAEASVLAIVFSVTVVALQLVATRYSARLTSLFIEDPLFRTTFALFVIGAAFNLVVVYLLPGQPGRAANAAVGIAFALAGAATYALYRFIHRMIRRSAPEELLEVLLTRELVPARFLSPTAEAFQRQEIHPIRPLYLIIKRAIDLDEYQTAMLGVEGLQTIFEDTFEYLAAEHETKEAQELASEVCSEVLTEYLPQILNQLYSHEQYEQLSETIETMEATALTALEYEYASVTTATADGLGTAFDETPLTQDGNRIRGPCLEALVSLTKAVARQADYNAFRDVLQNLTHQVKLLLRRRPDRHVIHVLLFDYYVRHAPDIFDTLVERYGPQFDDKKIGWMEPSETGEELPTAAKALRHFWREHVKVTQEILQYQAGTDQFPFTEGNIWDGWVRMIEIAADNDLNGLATLCCLTALQLGHRVAQIDEGLPGLLAHDLGRLRSEHDPSIVDTAFASLQAGKEPRGANISTHAGQRTLEKDDRGMLARILGKEEAQDSMEDWLVAFHADVKDRTESPEDQ